MASSSNFLHLLPLLVSLAIFLPRIRCDDNSAMISRCGKVVNKNQPSPTNADKMISNLLNFAPQNDFSYYTHEDTGLFGLAWCLGDAFAQNCSACLAGAAQSLINLCSPQTNSARIVFQDFCYLQLDTKDFLQTLDVSFTRVLRDDSEDQQVEQALHVVFGNSVFRLLNGLKHLVLNQKNKKFGRGQTFFDVENSLISGMAQCVDQLSEGLCARCLKVTINNMVLAGACNFSRRCQFFTGGGCILEYNAIK